jgi:small-conductance mechanosensitive channel
VLPNSDVYTNAVLVRTAYHKRRIRFAVGIGYSDSIDEARRIIRTALRDVEGVLDDPEPAVLASELAPSAVTLIVYFWTESVQANVLHVIDRSVTAVKHSLDKAGIEMPYPHQVILLQDADARRCSGPADQKNASSL